MVDLEHMRKIQNCLPFADENAGIVETQQAIGEMISELSQLRSELERVKVERDAIRELMNSYNLGGWTDAIAPMKRALAAESKLTASESARRVLVEEVVAARLDFNAQQSTCDQSKLMAASQRLDKARAAVDASGVLTSAGGE